MCLDNKQILSPVIDNHSGQGWRLALILALVVTGLFIIMLIICYFVRRNKTIPIPEQHRKTAPTPPNGRVAPILAAPRTGPPPSTRIAPPPPRGYQMKLPALSHSAQRQNQKSCSSQNKRKMIVILHNPANYVFNVTILRQQASYNCTVKPNKQTKIVLVKSLSQF